MHLNRRHFLSAAGTVAAAGCTATNGGGSAIPANPLDLDAIGQAQQIRNGTLSPLELLDQTIARIERLNPIINAVVATDFERARTLAATQTEALAGGRQPDGVLYGVPYLVKDLTPVAGVPMDFGSRLFAGTVAEEDGPAIAACRAAGMNIIGKTATPEFGLIGSTETMLHGPCRNPWSLDHSPGGSSGGTGAAIAAGMTPIASGSDGGGSIRIPASNCGVFGLKPSMGRNLGSDPSLPGGIAVKMALSRTVRDSALMLTLYENSGADAVGRVDAPLTRPLKIGLIITDHLGNQPHEDVAAAVTRTARLLEQLGHSVEAHNFPFDGHALMDHFMSIWTQGPKNAVAQINADGGRPEDLLEPWTLGLAEMGSERGPDTVASSVRWLLETTADPRIFADFDLLLSPTLNTPPARTGEQSPTAPFEEMFPKVLEYVSYTPLANVAGHAAMSVPLGLSTDGLPIGSHFMAPRGGERLLLELALQLEEAAPWRNRWAPHSAANV